MTVAIELMYHLVDIGSEEKDTRKEKLQHVAINFDIANWSLAVNKLRAPELENKFQLQNRWGGLLCWSFLLYMNSATTSEWCLQNQVLSSFRINRRMTHTLFESQ